jgi:CrcB protein
MMNWLWVAIGGATGAVARYGVGLAAGRMLGTDWPWGTLAVNVAGGFLMGVLISWLALRGGADQERWRLLLGVGVLGGFTTFSAFSLETILMLDRRGLGWATTYGAVSVIAAAGAVYLGLNLARRVLA